MIMKAFLIIIGVIIQVYFVVTFVLADILGSTHRAKQEHLESWWGIFTSPNQVLIVVLVVSLGIAGFLLAKLQQTDKLQIKAAFSIEALFILWISWMLVA